MTDISKYPKIDDEFLTLWNKTMLNDNKNMYFKVKEFIHNALTQQRTELENKFKLKDTKQ